MNRGDVKQLFKIISEIYPMFEVTTEKINTWTRLMKKMDLDRVMAKVDKHAMENKFSPTIAEIAAYPPEKNEHLEKMQRWKEESAQVSPEKKRQFAEEIKKLIASKRND